MSEKQKMRKREKFYQKKTTTGKMRNKGEKEGKK